MSCSLADEIVDGDASGLNAAKGRPRAAKPHETGSTTFGEHEDHNYFLAR